MTEWNQTNVTWMFLAAACFVFGVFYAWMRGRRFEDEVAALKSAVEQLADALDEVDEKASLESAYRSAGIDAPPSRRELDGRLRAFEDGKKRLPITEKYCVDCRFYSMGKPRWGNRADMQSATCWRERVAALRLRE
jgi:hypothetical protein